MAKNKFSAIFSKKMVLDKLKILVVIFLIELLIFPAPLPAQADEPKNCLIPDPFLCFYGIITKKQLKLCLVKINVPPFVMPHPVTPVFHYFEIDNPGNPDPTGGVIVPPFRHKLYYVYGGSESKYRNRREKFVSVEGDFIPGASEIIRATCNANKKFLPIAFGVIGQIGTGCKPGEIVIAPLTGKCRKAGK